jgi:uncharacterized alpha-E superfamily protein
MYRKKYGKLSSVLYFDREFPRSILACLISAEQSLIIVCSSVGFTNSATKQLGALKSQLEYIEIDEIISKGMHEYLDDIQRKLNISSAIYNSFFVVQLH